MEKVAARELYTKFDLPSEPGREVEEAVQFLDCLHSLVKATGGDSPAAATGVTPVPC